MSVFFRGGAFYFPSLCEQWPSVLPEGSLVTFSFYILKCKGAKYLKLRLEKSTGTALDGTGRAARFVGVLQGVDYSNIDTITIDFKLVLANSEEKTATTTITKVYTGLPGYDVTNDTLYFYFIIKGLEKSTYAGCSIQAYSKVTYTKLSENSYSATIWNNSNANA